jgi:hypothetical protein
LYFKPVRALTEAELTLVAGLQRDPEVDELIRMNYKPNEPAAPALEALFESSEPAPAPAPVKAKAKPAPVVVEEVEEDEEEAVAPVVKSKAKAQPAPTGKTDDLSDLMGEWDD